MPITILSPYSGRPVKVRDQDLERALRDEEGRVFYVVEGTDGQGYYASMTRKGSDKDQQRYRELAEKGAVLDPQAQANVQQMHDATGTQRRNPVGVMLLLLIGVALGIAVYAYVAHPEWLGLGSGPDQPADAPTPPTTPESDPDNPTGERTDLGLHHATVYYTSHRPPRIVPVARRSEDAAEPGKPAAADPPAAARLAAQPGPEQEQAAPAAPDADAPAHADEASSAPPAGPRSWRPAPAGSADADRPAAANPFADFRVTASGLRYKTTHLTDGPPAMLGCYLEVRYAAYALNGEPIIDDARHRFVIMTGKAIRALDEGLAGMREGEQRLIFVPKGHSTAGRLPGVEQLPDEPFVLDVQLAAVKPGITHVIEQAGQGDPAEPGDTLTLHYRAWVEGQTEPFDSSALRGRPMTVTLGQDTLIPGLELGVAGMRPGETRLLTIPPYLAYGDKEIAGGLIPANSFLTFRVTAEHIDH